MENNSQVKRNSAWISWPELADVAAAVLAAEADARAREQAVTDVDGLLERSLQDLLADGFAARGFLVERERRYPIHEARRRKSEGLRCDLVLSRPGAASDEGVWLEVKRAAQHVELSASAGFGGRLHRAATTDIAKLAADVGVRRGALLLVVHAADAHAGEAAVTTWAHRCLDEGLPIELPYVRQLPLMNRMGNAVSTLALVPVRAGLGASG